MIQTRTVLKVIDNSGARYIRCIKVLGKKKIGVSGDLIVGSVISLRRGRGRKIRVRRKEICLGLIVTTKKKASRHNSSTIKSYSNTVLLLNRSLKPIGNRVFGTVLKELRVKKRFKALSIASRII